MADFPLTATVDAPFRTCRPGARSAWLSLAAVVTSAVLLTGCATTKAATNVEGPPLAVPPAPERVVVPAEEEPLASSTVGPDTPLASVPRVSQQPPAVSARPRTNRTDGDARTDAAQAAASPAAAPPVPGPTAEGRPELRAVPASAQVAADQKRVQELLNKADADRKKVEQLKLSTTESNNLRESKRFSDSANEALKQGNLVFAFAAAQKAAELAAALAAR